MDDGVKRDILREARLRYAAGVDGDRYNRERDEEDRRFYKGGRDQWEESAVQARAGRPTMTINRLPQFVKQVTGEMRQNKPAIRVLPVDDQTDPQLAEVYSAIIRHIESNSDAHRIYSKAAEQAVIGGIGWFRILTDYKDETSFDQEIVVKHIRNPLSVVVDPDAMDLTRCDMNWAFVSELISEEKFKKAYPKVSLNGFETDDSYVQWKLGEFIRIAEYWVREKKARKLALLSDGSTRFVDEITPDLAAQMDQMGLTVKAERDVETYVVRWYRMTGTDIIDEGEWKGKHIPLIPVVGEEIEVGDEIFRHGLIHHAKDSQRSYNYSRSAMMEHVASQPKAPWLVTAKQIVNYKAMWEGLNSGNPPVLVYEPDGAAPPPQRMQPPTFAAAWYQEAQIADQDMKATTGIYDASLGKSGNETSGRAILARDSQGETATYVYVDNTSAAIRQAGIIMLDLIPHIYNNERVIRIMGEDNAIEGYAKINGMMPTGEVLNDISVGQFDLVVTTGPAYATKRMEAADKLMQLVQAAPQIAGVASDIIVQSLDVPNGDKLAERLKMLLPPGVDPEVDQQRQAMQQQLTGGQPDPMQELQQRGATAEVAIKEADAKLKEIQVVQAEGGFQQAYEQGAFDAGVHAGANMPTGA